MEFSMACGVNKCLTMMGFSHQQWILMDQTWLIKPNIFILWIYIYIYGYVYVYVLKNKGVVQLVCHGDIYIYIYIYN